jgi:hypothetical protein
MGVPLFGQEHVDRYRETDGEEGHDWQGATVLLLTTTGRNSGSLTPRKRPPLRAFRRSGLDGQRWQGINRASISAISSGKLEATEDAA